MSQFSNNGNLVPGIHSIEWDELVRNYSWTEKRVKLIGGLKHGLDLLKKAGCKTVYIDGSFVTKRDEPSDFDACWEIQGVNKYVIDPVFFDFDNRRANQKARFYGEFFPSGALADPRTNRTFLQFFQRDKHTDQFKGIIKLDLRRLP